MNQILLAILIFTATPEPVTRFSDKVEYATGTVYRCYPMDVPIYYHEDNTGKLLSVNLDAVDQSCEIGSRLFDKRVGLPMQSGILQETRENRIVVIHSDLDWKYPDRRMEWSIVNTGFDEKDEKIKFARAEKVSSTVRKVSEDFAIYNNEVRVRTAQKIKIKSSTDFCITHKLKLVDLEIKNNIDAKNFYIAENGEFFIVTPGGEERFRIGKPKILSSTFSVISDNTLHTLRWLGKDEYEYVKYPSPKLTLAEWQAGEWIDADTYTSASGGRVYHTYADWPTLRTESNGTSAEMGREYENIGYTYYNTTLYRNFFSIDTSGIVDSYTVTAGTWNYRMYFDATVKVSVQKGTHDPSFFTVDAYNDFSGSVYGTNSSSTSGWKSITLNATGLADISKTGTTKLCMREYDHDVVGTNPGSNNYYNRLYNTSPSSKPYLLITATAPSTRKPTTVLHYNRMRTNR